VTKKENNDTSFFGNDRNFRIIIVITIGLAVALSVGTASAGDILPNHITLIVKVAVGVIIAIIVFRLTKKSEIRNKITLEKIEELLLEQKKAIQGRRIYFRNNIRFSITLLGAYLADIRDQKTSSTESEEKLEFVKKEMNNLLGFCNDILTGVEIASVQALLMSIDNLKFDIQNKKKPRIGYFINTKTFLRYSGNVSYYI